jgi:hypothetical protein
MLRVPITSAVMTVKEDIKYFRGGKIVFFEKKNTSRMKYDPGCVEKSEI